MYEAAEVPPAGIVAPAYTLMLFGTFEVAVPATTQRPLLNRARATVSVSTCGVSTFVVVLHSGAAAELQTFSAIVVGDVVFGNVNVASRPVTPVGPVNTAAGVAVHRYVLALSDVLAES